MWVFIHNIAKVIATRVIHLVNLRLCNILLELLIPSIPTTNLKIRFSYSGSYQRENWRIKNLKSVSQFIKLLDFEGQIWTYIHVITLHTAIMWPGKKGNSCNDSLGLKRKCSSGYFDIIIIIHIIRISYLESIPIKGPDLG